MKKERQIYKKLYLFVPGLIISLGLSKLSDNFTLFFFYFERP